jgi:hypothetical protein
MFYHKPFSIFPNCYVFPLQTEQTYQFSNLEIVKLENEIGHVKHAQLVETILGVESSLVALFQQVNYPEVSNYLKGLPLDKLLEKNLTSLVNGDIVKLYGLSKKNINITITGLWYQQHKIGLLYKLS